MRSVLAFFLSRSRPLVLTVVFALAVSCWSIYGFIGYFHYEQIAKDERLAAERAERANADLQDALDRLRDRLAAAQAQIEALRNEPAGQLVLSDGYKLDRLTPLARAFDRVPLDLNLPDPQLATLAASLAWEPTKFSDNQTHKKLQQLSAERDEVLAERDELRARVSDLEERFSSLQSGEALAPKDAPNNSSTTSDTAAQGTARIEAASEQPPQALKNFASPVWVPDHFRDESGPILGNPVAHPPKRALNGKEGST